MLEIAGRRCKLQGFRLFSACGVQPVEPHEWFLRFAASACSGENPADTSDVERAAGRVAGDRYDSGRGSIHHGQRD